MSMRAAGWLCGWFFSVWALPASAAVCTFNNSGGNWNEAANWSGCSGGAGTPSGTPGLGDTAIINGATGGVQLPEAVAVATLQLTGTRLEGPGGLIIGTLQATNAVIAGDAGNPQPVSVLVSDGSINGSFQLERRQLQLIGPGIFSVDGGATLAANTPQPLPCPNIPVVDVAGDLCILASGKLHFSGAAGTTALAGVALINHGLLQVESGRTLTFDSLPMTASAKVRLNGGTLDASGDYEIYQGTLTGSGTIAAQLAMFGGIVDPGDTTAGVIQVNGPMTLGSSVRAVFDLYDQAGGHDRINVTGTARSDGIIETRSALSSASASFILISSGNVAGTPTAQNAFPLSHQLVRNDVAETYSLDVVSGIDVCTWNGGTGPYNSASSWSNCSGATPDSGDSILIDGGSAVAQVASPASIGRVQLRNGATLQLTSPGAVLTVVDYFDLSAGQINGSGSVVLSGGVSASIGGAAGTRLLDVPVINSGALTLRTPFSTTVNGTFTNNGLLYLAGVPFDAANQTLSGSGAFANSGGVFALQGTEARIDLPYSQGASGALNLDTEAALRVAATGSFDGLIGSGPLVSLEFTGSSWVQQPGSEIEVNGFFKLSTDTTLQGTFFAQQLDIENNQVLTLQTTSFSSGMVTAFRNAQIDVQAVTSIDRLNTLGARLSGSASLTIANEWVIEAEIQPTAVSGNVSTNAVAVVRQRGNADLSILSGGIAAINGSYLFELQNPSDPQGDAGLSIDPAGTLFQNGALFLEPQGRISLSGDPAFGSGSALILDDLSTLTVDGGSGNLDLGQTVLRGLGTIVGSVYNDSGVISPGISMPGVLTINGDYEQAGSGRIDLELGGGARGGPGNDRLDITGDATLGGVVNIVQAGGFDPPPGPTYTFMSYASYSGSFTTTNFPPVFDDTHQMVLTPTAYRMQPDGGGGPFDCTWTAVSQDDWNVASNWSCLQVPGPGDTARVLSGTADIRLNGARSVAVLEFTGGRIGGSGTLAVSGALNWSGGTFEGNNPFTDAVTLDSSATSTLASGGPRFLKRMRMTNNGTLNWTGGDLQLQTSDTEFDNAGTLNFNAGAGSVTILSDGAPNVIFHNLIVASGMFKNGAGDLVFEANLDFLNGALTQINDGRLWVKSNGSDIGQYFISTTGTLEFTPSLNRTLNSPATISGFGPGILKVGGTGTTAIGGGVYSGTPETRVFSGTLSFGGPQTLSKLQVAGGELFGGDEALTVSTALLWSGGQINGPASSMFTVNGTATLNGGPKRLIRRNASFNGMSDWTTGDLILDSSSTVTIAPAATLIANPTSGDVFVYEVGGTSAFTVLGTLEKRNPGFDFRFEQVPAGGNGSFVVTEGALVLHDGIAAGFRGAAMGDSGLIQFESAPVTLGPSVSFTGTGAIGVSSGTAVTFQSAIGSQLGLLVSGTVTADFAAPATFAILQINSGGALLGSTNLTVGELLLLGGTVSGDPGTTLTVAGPGLNSQLFTIGTDNTLSNRRLLLNTRMTWLRSNLDINNNAQIQILPAGEWVLGSNTAGVRQLNCSNACASQVVVNNGLLRVAPSGGIHRFSTTVNVSNSSTGTIAAETNRLDIDGMLANAGQLTVRAGATLGKSIVGTFDLGTGSLRGAGNIAASLLANSSAFIQPDTLIAGSIGTLTIGGDLFHNGGGELRMEVNGTGAGQFDQIVVTGNVSPGPVNPSGSGLTTGQSVPFITHATRTGNYTALTGPNVASYTLDNGSSTQTLLRGVSAGAQTCIWDHTAAAPHVWENASHWSCGAVPGPADTAIFDDAPDAAILTQDVTVGTLDLRAGSITGDFNLDIATSFLWTGGSMVAASTSSRTRVTSAATATLSGGQKTLTNRELTLEGSTGWSTGLIELRDGARTRIASGTTFTSTPGPADEFFIGTGLADGQLINEGSFVKTGSNVSGIDPHVAYNSTAGGLDVQAGTFRMRGGGTYGGTLQVASGALLEFSYATRNFPSGATLSGAGDVRFGDQGAQTSVNAFDATFSNTGTVRVENATVTFGGAGASFTALVLDHPSAVLSGSGDFSADALMWHAGTVDGTSAVSMIVGTTLQLDNSIHVLEGRRLHAKGAATWTQGNIDLRNGALLQIGSGATLDVNPSVPLTLDCSVGCTGATLLNQGSIMKVGALRVGGGLTITAAVSIDNAGLLDISSGELEFAGPFNTQSGSVVDVHGSGTLRVTSGTNLAITQGILRGNGTITADLVSLSSPAEFTPNPGGSAPGFGIFTIGGNFDHSGGGILEIDVDDTMPGMFDLVQVLGVVNPGPVRPAGAGLTGGASVAFIQHSGRQAPYDTLVGPQAGDYALDNYLAGETRLVYGGGFPAYTVDRSDDPVSPLPSDEACTSAPNDCTLRGAINAANAGVGQERIEFAIPSAPGAISVIAVTSPLPALSDDVEIDATTQPGFVPNTNLAGGLTLAPKVEINGAALSGPTSIGLAFPNSFGMVQGLAIADFERAIVADAVEVQLSANFIGLHADGSDSNCLIGVETGADYAGIGGGQADARNLISGCDVGILINGDSPVAFVEGNLIGTNVAGTATIAGQAGIVMTADCGIPARRTRNGPLHARAAARGIVGPAALIGGPGDEDNVIGGQLVGIALQAPFGLNAFGGTCLGAGRVSIEGNDIGVQGGGGTGALPNGTAILWEHAAPQPPNASVNVGRAGDPSYANRIFNSALGSAVVVTPPATGLEMGVNQLSGNAGLPFDLRPDLSPSEIDEPNQNDALDADSGPNNLQNFARITSINNRATNAGIDLNFRVDSDPANSAYGSSGLHVDFYLNDGDGESVQWLDSTQWTAADFAAGSKVYKLGAGTVPTGGEVLTVVTDANGISSEFSFFGTGLSVSSITPEPADVGTNRTITGQILAANGEPFRPSGTITATDGIDSCGTPVLTPGSAGQTLFSCTMPTTGAAGTRMIFLGYVPDDHAFQGSSSVIGSTVQVGAVSTTTSIVSISPQPSQPGQPITLTVSVSATTGVPTGTVTVTGAAPFDLDTCTASLSPSGPNTATGSCTITPTTPGARSFAATYPGSGSFAVSSSSSVTQVVVGTTSFGTLQQSAATTAVGEVFTVDVVLAGTGGTPTGTVTVTPLPLGIAQNCNLVAVPQTTNQAGCSVNMVSPVALGKVLLVRYNGSPDLVYPAMQSNLTHNTTRAPTTASITSDSPDPSNAKQAVTVQFQVQTGIAGAVSSFAPLSGSVTVTDGLDSCTGLVTSVTIGTSTSGSCQLILRAAGTRQLVATYQGNENFALAVSPAESHVVSGTAGADLSVTVRNSSQVVNAGGAVEYVIDVLNSGTSVAGSSRVVNALPAQMPNATWVCVPTAPSQCPPSGSGAIDQLVDLTGGGRVTFRLTGVVNGPEGTIVDTATVTPAAGVTDPDLSNNTSTDTDIIGLFANGFEDATNE